MSERWDQTRWRIYAGQMVNEEGGREREFRMCLESRVAIVHIVAREKPIVAVLVPVGAIIRVP